MKRFSIFLLFSTLIHVLCAAQATFTVNAPGRIQAGNKFPVTFVLKNGDGSASSLKVPQINGCTLLYGPTTTTSQSYQIINGRQSSSSTIEFTYYYRADKEGTYTIGSASIASGGKTLRSTPVSLTITPASAPQSGNTQGQHRQPVDVDDIATQTAGREIKASDVFIRIHTTPGSVVEGEAIECTIKLYTKYGISEMMTVTQPTFNGFLVEELPIQQLDGQRETVNGQEYITAIIKKCILFPQKSGKLTIVSGSYDLKVEQFEQINMGFYTVPQPVYRKIRVNSNSATVNINPLPQPQPAGFSGAVGQFNATARLSSETFRTNEPVTLTYTIQGTGNIKYIKDSEIDFPAEFEQYTPQHSVDAAVKGNTVAGKSVSEYTFVPKEVGNYTLTVPDFIYYNPAKKEYATIKMPSYTIKVGKGLSAPTTTERQDVKAKNVDILYINTEIGNLRPDHPFMLDKAWYWLLFALVGVIPAGAILFASKRSRRSADVAGLRKSKASKVARRRLSAARKAMGEGNAEKFHAETLRAIWGYLSDKLSIPASQMSRSTIAETLSGRGVPEPEIQAVINVIDTCEMARYAPSTSSEELEKVYGHATDAINSLEKIKLR